MNDRLVWIDCEMTGLDLACDALIEIACLVTDGELNILDDGVDVIIKPPPEAVDQMSNVVREMHTKSGLLAGLGQGVTLDEAQDIVLSYIQQHISEPRRVPLCGNSIATDRSFIARDMPQLDAYLHYRMVDVSSIKELARRWYPRVYFATPGSSGAATARSPTSERASRSCATTARPSSCPSRAPTRRPRGRPPPGSARSRRKTRPPSGVGSGGQVPL